METRTTVLNFQPGTSIPTVHVSQYDVGVLLRFIIYDGTEIAEIEGGSDASIVVTATRPSGTGFSVACDVIASNIVEVATTDAMTIEFGTMDAEVRYTKNGVSVGTGNFKFIVEAAAHADYIVDEDHAEWVRIAQEVSRDKASAESAKTSAQASANAAAASASSIEGAVDAAVAAAQTATNAKNEAVEQRALAQTAAENAAMALADADAAATNAELDALNAEAYAVGTRNGEPVGSTDPTYQNNAKYYAEQGGAGNLASVFSTSVSYAVGDYALYGGKLYRFITAHSAGAWNASHVVEIKAMDEVSDLKDDLDELSEAIRHIGISSAISQALLDIFRHVAYEGTDGQDYYDALEEALLDTRIPTSISAVFSQEQNKIYTTESLDVLRKYLTVTAHYEDQTTSQITNYTLSGTLSKGTSTITVSYKGKTTTFNASVSYGYRIAGDKLKITGNSNNYPYTNATDLRLSYTDFDILLEGGKSYRVEMDSSVSTANMGIQGYNQSVLTKVSNHQDYDIIDTYDPGWQSLPTTYSAPALVNNSPFAGLRFTLRKDSNNSPIGTNFVTEIRITEVS